MAINVPQSVFDKYFEVIDSTFDIFGVTCQLVSIEKKEVIVHNPDNNLPDINSILIFLGNIFFANKKCCLANISVGAITAT